ncbi:MAG TPA: SMP-30/gluconolactonase/LRE family protein [Caulobacteraceae bacterium]
MEPQVSVAFEGKNVLGEGPIWDAATKRLYWFDIKQALLYWGEPNTGACGSWALPCRASAAAIREAGGLLLASEQGLADFDLETGGFVVRRPLAAPAGFRSNDGKIDVRGRFWFGTMDDHHGERPGVLYRYDPDGTLEEVLDGIHIVNTVSCSPDGRTYYLADSRRGVIWAFDMDEAGRLSNRRVLVETAAPDGSAVDADGYLWNAQWGSWRVVRYGPDGSVDRVIEVPAAQPSSCAFGGDDLTTLFITTAREDLLEAALSEQPWAGSVLKVETGVKGLPLPRFAG